MIFITESGSTYEIDQDAKKIRRLEGKTGCTPRVGVDGEWKDIISAHPILEGMPVVITWGKDIHPPPVVGSTPATVTSRVVEIVEDTGEN